MKLRFNTIYEAMEFRDQTERLLQIMRTQLDEEQIQALEGLIADFDRSFYALEANSRIY